MKCIQMNANAYSPEAILHEGGVYLVPDGMAKKLLSTRMVGHDNKQSGPAVATLVTDPKLREKAQRLPSQPDPEDTGDMVEEADFADDTDADEPE